MMPYKNSIIYAIYIALTAIISVVVFTMFRALYTPAFVRCMEFLTEHFKYREIMKNSLVS